MNTMSEKLNPHFIYTH